MIMKQYNPNRHHPSLIKFDWFVWATISVVPVIYISYILCYYERAESILGLFLVEWLVVILFWKILCPWLGAKSIALASVLFLLSFCMAAIVCRENTIAYGTVWTGSDDWWYLNQAGDVVRFLHASNGNPIKAWNELTSNESGRWSLSGWPFLLGYISSLITSEPEPNLLHAIALSLNSVFLTCVLALVYNIIDEPAKCFPWRTLFFSLLIIFDPIIYAAMSLKESMLQLSLMLTFVFCYKSSRQLSPSWFILGLIGIIGLITCRVVYIFLIAILIGWIILNKYKTNNLIKIAIYFTICAVFWKLFFDSQLREQTIAEYMIGRSLEGQEGLAMRIYKIKLIGPIIFYALSPMPPLPWKILTQNQIIVVLIRGIGSVAWVFSAYYVLRGIFSNPALFKNRLFVAAGIMFLGLFAAAVIYADDSRYKQPTNFFLGILLVLTWYNGRINRWPCKILPRRP